MKDGTPASDEHVDHGPDSATATSAASAATSTASHPPTTGGYVSDDVVQLQVPGGRPATIFVNPNDGYHGQVPLGNDDGSSNGGYASELTSAADDDINTSTGYVTDTTISVAAHSAIATTDMVKNSGYVEETSVDQAAGTRRGDSRHTNVNRRISYVAAMAVADADHAGQPSVVSNRGVESSSSCMQETALVGTAVYTAQTLSAVVLPPPLITV